MPDSKRKVLLAMSGGVDSSAAAILLKRAGYDVIGITMKLWSSSMNHIDSGAKNCCSVESVNDAKYVCQKLGIPHYVVDNTSQFRRNVIEDFISEYFSGRTPNPCIRCNTYMKWGEMVNLSRKLDAQFISTGHYARVIQQDNGEYILSKGVDEAKDQSYALWGIKKELLPMTILPIGNLLKSETRDLLRRKDIYFSDKEESQEICFIPDNDLGRFLNSVADDSGNIIKKGPIVDTDGRVLGEHNGIVHYTIGQRKGLGISHSVPLYVKEIDVGNNTIVVSEDNELKSRNCIAGGINWLIPPPHIDETLTFDVKIRYKHTPSKAECKILDDGLISITYQQPQRAITPGQSAVFYRGDRLCGGGIIQSVL